MWKGLFCFLGLKPNPLGDDSKFETDKIRVQLGMSLELYIYFYTRRLFIEDL